MTDLPILQKVYDLICWYVPILDRLPRNQKFALGDRLTQNLYELLDGLIVARYKPDKMSDLILLNSKLEVMRYQTRLLMDFNLISIQRYEHAVKLIDSIGRDLGGWIRQQQNRSE
jgi:hypothetical protein